jgi:hypothetical protein
MDRRLALFGTLAISAALAGCTSSGPRPTGSLPRPTLSVPVATGNGAIVGGIYRCFGLPPSISGPPTRVAGTVDVFTDEGGVASQASFAQAFVATGGTYRFNLPAGDYVLVGHWTGSNLHPPMVTVTVTAGKITHQDLDYRGCI